MPLEFKKKITLRHFRHPFGEMITPSKFRICILFFVSWLNCFLGVVMGQRITLHRINLLNVAQTFLSTRRQTRP